MDRPRLSSRFPDFPWDTLADAKQRAHAHPDGIVDLSIGTPVDPTPSVAREALAAASDAPGYPTVAAPEAVRQAAVDWLERRLGVTGLSTDQVLLTVGSKELIANLPSQLALGPADTVVLPSLAYPTYEVGARFAGARVVLGDPVADGLTDVPALVYVNSPANPHGEVLSAEHLRAVVRWCRERGALLVSDECYADFGWEREPVSVLHPDVCEGSHDGLLAVHSTSKRSNLAGYRAGFVAGDATVVAELLAVRKHLGFMLPTPVQQAFAAAIADDEHVVLQRRRYAERRDALRRALESAGFTITHSEGSLYLWATRGEGCRDTVAWLAERGILVAPGDFYGERGAQHVRVAFTATDERVAAAVARLTES
ncbi:succinyldiaminopimelate transaminase [Aeromicrobium sp. SORGH_AS981]|uniref:succinyldiaminopimelate transaminase n=1 Tax=Aeromicrobium sp. SORGH_AS_0981 TaxID=3041802 RepID=UPI00285C0BB6|nr:succinyldiaminopimelate transaminase [Aeromicrobium sp. SORGH_AS_0981]MDR6118757.1 succinyldiaminopimelate transaminase [Aeromicrobium sp. SORGH_AS_0981]